MTVNFLAFPSVKFRKIWQTGSSEHVFTQIYEKLFRSSERHKFEKIEKMPVQTLLFSRLKFVSSRMRCAVKLLEDFTEGNSRKSQMKL